MGMEDQVLHHMYENKLRFNYNSKGKTTSVDVVPAGQADSDAILYLTFLYNSLGALYRITNQVTDQVVTLSMGLPFLILPTYPRPVQARCAV